MKDMPETEAAAKTENFQPEPPLETNQNAKNAPKSAKTKEPRRKIVPFRLIGMIITMLIVVCFAGFNIDNRSNVSLVFYTFENVPVFVTMFCSFCLGILFTIPFTIGRDSARRKAKAAKTQIAALKAENAKYLKEKEAKLPKKKHGKNKKGESLAAETGIEPKPEDKKAAEAAPADDGAKKSVPADNKKEESNQEAMLSNVGYF